jgi:dienelactone hydrolase
MPITALRPTWLSTCALFSADARLRSRIARLAAALATGLLALAGTAALAQSPFREEILPKAGKGPAVLIIAGAAGPDPRRNYAKDIAAEGYHVMLVDGREILSRNHPGAQNFKDAVAALLASPATTSTKVAVIGFSQGGGAVLAQAIHQPETVSGAVAYYPATSWVQNMDGLVNRIQVPLLFLAAEADTYNNCCLFPKAKEIEAAAKAKGRPFEFVSYPNAEHGFDLTGRNYRSDYVKDAWSRTLDALKKAHANTAKP